MYSSQLIFYWQYVLGVGSGWVVVSVGGEVVSRLGGGAAGPCHSGPLTDLHIHSSHLYTVGEYVYV